MRLFLAGAIVLIVLGIIASAVNSQQALGVWWYTWLMASLLSFFVDLLFPITFGPGGVTYPRRTNVNQP